MEADSLALSANVIGHYHCFIFGYHARVHQGSASVCSPSGLTLPPGSKCARGQCAGLSLRSSGLEWLWLLV